ncbi:MAG: MBL fold metallo-hydrolase [Myxococcales bacterium]|nr:MBL fold metallo-hydrolase [Myxococcales bacterium]
MTFWGVRGSIPMPGADTQRWGGNSSCVEVRHGTAPPIVLDCGTGARSLGFKLVGEPGRQLELLFSHFHMDHVFGFPFFVPIYTPGYDVTITVPAFSEDEAREKLGRYLNGVYHPTRLRELPCSVSFRPIRSGRSFSTGPFEVRALSLNHPGGAMGYRIEAEGTSLAYITDTAPFARPGEGVAAGEEPAQGELRVIEFLRGCDVVIYDTMYDYGEYLEKMTWGHSYPEYALALTKVAEVSHLVLFHHLPDASDEDLDVLSEKWSAHAEPRVTVAREGQTLSVGQTSK